MKNHETGNDFLDELYAHNAKETPPIELDQAILKQAHDNLHQRNFVSRSQWQQLFSVAAVMVLSVYFIFDIGNNRFDTGSHSLEMEEFSYAEERIKVQSQKTEIHKLKKAVAPAAYESATAPDDISISESESVLMLRSSNPEFLSDSIKEPTNEIKSHQYEEKIESKNIRRKLSTPMNDEGVRMTNAKAMLATIERLIAEGKLSEAKKIYKDLSTTYPKYQVPTRIVEALK